MKQQRRVHAYRGSRRKTILLCICAVLLVILFLLGIYVVGRVIEGQGQNEEIRGDLTGRLQERRTVTYKDKTYQYRKNLTTILFMGIDRETAMGEELTNYRSGGQADFLLLMVIDGEGQIINTIQIDRDTMAEITIVGVLGNVAGTRNAQICLSHGFGDGAEQSALFTADAVSKLLYGVDIDFYVSLNLDAIPILNDTLGGVTVTLQDDFSTLDPSMVPGTTLTLQGEQAAYYVRHRMGIGEETNASRQIRQRDYMGKVGDMLNDRIAQNANFVGELFDAMEIGMLTNMKRGRMINEAYYSRSYERQPIISPQGQHTVGADGFVEFHADESALEQLVLDVFFQEIEPA